MRGELDVSGSKGVPFTSVREELDLEGCDLCGHELNVYEEEFNNRPPAQHHAIAATMGKCGVCAEQRRERPHDSESRKSVYEVWVLPVL